MGQALLSLEEIEKLYAEEALAAEKGITYSGISVSTKGKNFTLPNGRKGPGPMRAIILDFLNGNFYYDGPYNPSKPSKPSCWAIGNGKHVELVPSTDVKKPCGTSCAEVKNWQKLSKNQQKAMIEQGVCPFAQWGSDPQYGKGKACKAQIMLAIVPEDGVTDETPVWLLRVNRSSLKNFYTFQSRVLQQLNKHTAQVAVDISFDPSFDYPVLLFTNEKIHSHLREAFALKGAATEVLENAANYSDNE